MRYFFENDDIYLLKLGAAGASESIKVTAEAPIVETTRTQVSATVNERAIANLPANGRNFIDFVLLTPGVTKIVLARGRVVIDDGKYAGKRGDGQFLKHSTFRGRH